MPINSINYNVETQQTNTLNTNQVQQRKPEEYVKHSEPISIDERNKVSSEFAGSKLQGKFLNFAIDILAYLRSNADGNSDIEAVDVEEFVMKNYAKKV